MTWKLLFCPHREGLMVAALRWEQDQENIPSMSENRRQGSCSTKKPAKMGQFSWPRSCSSTRKEGNCSWAAWGKGRTFSKKSLEKVRIPRAFIMRARGTSAARDVGFPLCNSHRKRSVKCLIAPIPSCSDKRGQLPFGLQPNLLYPG